MRLAISGATGYIGERLVHRATALGHEIVTLTRRSPALADVAWIPFDLHDTTEIELPHDVDALVHLAATTLTPTQDILMELLAAQRLIAAATRQGARFIFVSSQAAAAHAPTGYGRSKWMIEQAVLASGGIVVRPGQVYGGPERALFGTLVATVRALPLLPAFMPAPYIQPVHVDDLVEALLRVASRRDFEACTLCVGAPIPVSFTRFLQVIARLRLRRVRLAMPIPIAVVRMASRLLGPRRSSRVGLDRLNSLFELQPMETTPDLERLGLALRPLEQGILRSGNGARRVLLQEGRALLSYVLRAQPRSILLRRYVRAMEQTRGHTTLALPTWMINAPLLVTLIDGAGKKNGGPGFQEFNWRLHAAVILAEASPQGAKRFLGNNVPAGFIYAGLGMSLSIAREVAWRLASFALTPLLAPSLRRAGIWK